MCGCVRLACLGIETRRLGLVRCNSKLTIYTPDPSGMISYRFCTKPSNGCNPVLAAYRNGGFQFTGNRFVQNGCEIGGSRSMNSVKMNKSDVLGPENYDLFDEFGFKEKDKRNYEFETRHKGGEEKCASLNWAKEKGIGFNKEERVQNDNNSASVSSDFDFLETKTDLKNENRSTTTLGNEDLTQIEGSSRAGSAEDLEQSIEKSGLKGGRRQVIKRSSMLAKQVISVQSALSLGFVSQLWVDTNSWEVLVIEVRPSLLSGETERFLLDDVFRVGDVVLVQDECILENQLKMIGLDTLVGYDVVTPSRHNIGKVRGYNFSINSGAVESLEFDSFGISVIPSSLVSIYALSVDDVLEVASDTVVVHEAAASHVQRLTKGFWDTRYVAATKDGFGGYSDIARGNPKSFRRRFGSKKRKDDDWGLPMDYL
ncbi:PREDICTED: uncharacterized protein LOC104588355 [Nelumbo nucifera]|uniref:Uncharacterized protein LOC104588355 n=1 Tax=Nelumbo nucifera TaxID=4432 RepID=A0A1U7Z1Q2_NELNU|nr:PREDICTED: uncharacterized protein LOC104588355 [Nelumbo nucifera]